MAQWCIPAEPGQLGDTQLFIFDNSGEDCATTIVFHSRAIPVLSGVFPRQIETTTLNRYGRNASCLMSEMQVPLLLREISFCSVYWFCRGACPRL
jgi:hypothetical protein